MKKLSPSETRKSLIRRMNDNSTLDTATGCLNWNKGKIGGYGRIKFLGIDFFVHRVSYSINVSKIPDGMFVLHKCDNRSCINPSHLFIGSKRDNIMDAINKGRAPLRSYKGHKLNHGTACKRAKVNEIKVKEIRKLWAAGRSTQGEISKLFGISRATVSSIVTRRSWFYV